LGTEEDWGVCYVASRVDEKRRVHGHVQRSHAGLGIEKHCRLPPQVREPHRRRHVRLGLKSNPLIGERGGAKVEAGVLEHGQRDRPPGQAVATKVEIPDVGWRDVALDEFPSDRATRVEVRVAPLNVRNKPNERVAVND